MSDKKLKAFLQKNKSKKTKQAETKVEESPSAVEEAKDQPAQDAEVIQKQEPKAAKQKGQESSEDEDDDTKMDYGPIEDKKADSNANKQNKADYFENEAKQTSGTTAATKAKGPSEITFGGGKPKFGRGKGKLGGEFSKGLDDLDEDGGDDGKQDQNEQDNSGPGGRQFVNLSSAARTSGNNQKEEEKDSKPTGVKPKFFGKANLKGTGGGQDKDQDNAGGNRTYDFAVAFRGQGDDKRGEKNEERKGEERQGTAQRGGRRGGRGGRGRGFGPSQAQQDEDDGFEVVRGGRQKPKRQANDDSDSDEPPAQGGGRGGRGRGRGGFFTNSGKNRIQD